MFRLHHPETTKIKAGFTPCAPTSVANAFYLTCIYTSYKSQNSTPLNHKLLVSLWLFGSAKCLAGQCFDPYWALKPVQILCAVEHIACLILEDLADYVMRTRKTRCRQANERWTGSDGNKLKITGKRSNDRLGFNLSVNWKEFVIFVMPTQDKHAAHISSAGLINSRAYKLTKNQQLTSTSTNKLTNS